MRVVYTGGGSPRIGEATDSTAGLSLNDYSGNRRRSSLSPERGEVQVEHEVSLGIQPPTEENPQNMSQRPNSFPNRVNHPTNAHRNEDQNPIHNNQAQPAQTPQGTWLQDQNPDTTEHYQAQEENLTSQGEWRVEGLGTPPLLTQSEHPQGDPPMPPQDDQINPQLEENTQHPIKRGKKNTKAAIRLATLNIRGGGLHTTHEKWQHINQIIRDKKIAVLAIQETHLSETNTESLNNQFHGRMKILNNEDPLNPSTGRGIAFVLNKHLTSWKEAKVKNIIPGRASLLILPWQKTSMVNILTIYAPNVPQENAEFWSTLSSKWEDENLPIPDVMLGDFNAVEEAIDRFPPHRDNPQAVSNLANFKALHALQDGWRHCNPSELAFSYTQEATQSRSRID